MSCSTQKQFSFFYYRLRLFGFILILLISLTGCRIVRSPVAEQKEYHIIESPSTFSFNMSGNIDETRYIWPHKAPDIRAVSSFRITNTGSDPVINPRIAINGFRMPLTTEELFAILTHNSENTLDTVLRCFYTMIDYSIHSYPVPKDNADPLYYFINDCSGDCAYHRRVQQHIWDYLNLRYRGSGAIHHSVSEVELGDRSFHFDSNHKAYFLSYDNRTIASAQEIRDDPMLILRGVSYRHPVKAPRTLDAPLHSSYWSSPEKVAALFPSRKRSPEFQSGILSRRQLHITLRPGESYGWHTDKRRHFHPSRKARYFEPAARDITWETSIDFSNPAHRWMLTAQQRNEASREGTISLSHKEPLVLAYSLPWPVIDAEVVLKTASPDDTRQVHLSITGKKKHVEVSIPLFSKTQDSFVLDKGIYKLSYPLRNVRFEFVPGKQSSQKDGKIALQGITLILHCQSTSWACPGLRVGNNSVTYSDASEERQVLVSLNAPPLHKNLPRFTKGTFFPHNGSEVPESKLMFRWPESTGARAEGHQIQISAHEDMRYPLSPTFDRIITGIHGSDGTSFTFPWHGMFPIGEKLYWRIRPYSEELLTGDWSKARSFVVRGPFSPAVPLIKEKNGIVKLEWTEPKAGTHPVYYEIHTSNLEGFMPVDKPHQIIGYSEGPDYKYTWADVKATDWPVVPSTFLTTTTETNLTIFDPDTTSDEWRQRIGAHYRIIAVDSEGSKSCPSPQAHLRSPFLAAPRIVELPPGEVSWDVPCINTDGQITCKSGYHMGLWKKSELSFSLVAEKDNLQRWRIDPHTGCITGNLNRGETVTLKVMASDQFNRSDMASITFKGTN